jgi:hypothetical protein
MYFSIIPFTHSIGINPLVYSSDEILEEDIQIGTIVEIPYGKGIENGIIAEKYMNSPIEINTESYTRIKTISRIVTTKKILAPYQIQMISMLAEKYMIPIHRVLGIFLTRPILTRLERKNYEQLEEKLSTPNENWSGKFHITQEWIVTPELLESYINWPTIVVLPDDFAMMPYREYLKNQEWILFIGNDMTDTRKAQAWIDISNGVFSTIYWTRKILYYNLSHYKNIIYIEDSLGPNYWHYPIRIRYNDILRIFVEVNPHITFSILSSVPTITALNYFRHFEIKNIEYIKKINPWNKI